MGLKVEKDFLSLLPIHQEINVLNILDDIRRQ